MPKLLDFGVARARGRLAQTEAGTIKGKLRYMAPEQVSQGPLDHRADIFSLGVCLFELTTGHHPFGPPNGSEVATLKNIMNGVISRPTTLVPGYPPALEAILLSAIELDVQKRCPSAAEFRQRLDAFVAASGGPSTNPGAGGLAERAVSRLRQPDQDRDLSGAHPGPALRGRAIHRLGIGIRSGIESDH